MSKEAPSLPALEGNPYSEEPLQEEDIKTYYEEALASHGYPNLVDLLDRTKETTFLNQLSEWGKNPFRRPPALLGYYGIEAKIIPPENLFGVCGWTHCARGKEVTPTDVGRTMAYLFTRLPDLHLFLIDGGSLEATKAKTPENLRDLPHVGSFSPWRVTLKEGNRAPLPSLDLDILMVNPSYLNEKQTRELLKNSGLIKKAYAKIGVIRSIRRPQFKRVEISLKAPGEENSFSLAHLAFSENINGRYSWKDGLIAFIMSRPHLVKPVLLVPIRGKKGEVLSFRGVALDIYKKEGSYKLTFGEKGKEKSLAGLLVEWPDTVFPKGSWKEKYGRFLHFVRTLTWGGFFPLINAPETIDFNNLPKSSQRSSSWLYHNIIAPISSYPDFLGNTLQRKACAEALINTLVKFFDGNPYLAALWCLPEGEGVSDVPVSGMGIFGAEGFFPTLGHFLEEREKIINRDEGVETKTRKERLLKTMRDCADRGSHRGWETFVEFLYHEAVFGAVRGIYTPEELLTPSFYPKDSGEFNWVLNRTHKLFSLWREKSESGRWSEYF